MIDLNQVTNQGLINRNVKSNEKRDMTCFHAADCEKNVFDLYHSLIGTPPTNPPDIFSLNRFLQGELAEHAQYLLLDEMGQVKHGGEKQYEIDEVWNGIRIIGHPDFILKDDTIVEVKSWWGYYNEQELKAGRPKTNYLKQLAVYMFFLKVKEGALYMVPLEPSEKFQFPLTQISPGVFKCGDIQFDITQEFFRWKRLWEKNVLPRIEPKSEYRYKTPLAEINWATVPKSTVTEVRMGRKVVGDWQVAYSNYKDLIVKQEGTTLGYSLEELALINKLTAGYTSKK